MLEIIICAISGASIGSSIALIHSTRKARKQQITTKKNELYMMMQDFNEFYDGYQEFFEQNLDEENFIKVLKKRNLITGEYAIVTFGDSKCQIPVYNSEMMRMVLLYEGEYILSLVQFASELYNFKKEDILNYSEFSSRLYDLKKTCEKFGNEIMVD